MPTWSSFPSFEWSLSRSCWSIRSPAKLQRSRPNGSRVALLPTVSDPYCLPQRLPQPVPRSRLPVQVAFHTAWRVKAAQVVRGVERARSSKSLDTPCYTSATAREAPSNLLLALLLPAASAGGIDMTLPQTR